MAPHPYTLPPPPPPPDQPPPVIVPPPVPPIIDPDPWINPVIPPDDEKRPPPPGPPDVIIEPREQPPPILPPPPDLTPPTIVPPEVEDPVPPPEPDPVTGITPIVKPPPSIIILGPGSVIGTFMVYVGSRLVLTMAAAARDEAVKMLIGALNKRMARGTSIRFNTGNSPGKYWEGQRRKNAAVSYIDAWRQVPQEYSYWEK